MNVPRTFWVHSKYPYTLLREQACFEQVGSDSTVKDRAAAMNTKLNDDIIKSENSLPPAQMFAAEALQPLLEALPNGLILFNAQYRLVYLNTTAAMLLARQPEEVLNAPLREVLSDILGRVHEAGPLITALNTITNSPAGSAITEEVEVTLKGNEGENDSFLRLSFFPVEAQGPQPPGYGLLLQDVTRNYIADKLKNEFVAVVSHELRTPLSAMQGFSELLLTQEASPERRKLWLEMINRESVRLSSLIEDLLSLSRIESGRIDLRPERVELESVIRQCIEILRVGSSKHSFKIEIEENLPSVKADRDKLIQVLNNIVGNAIKYSSKGGQIVVRAGYSQDDPEHVLVSVTDQGVGITKAEVPRVFEKFYRVRGINNKEVKGTGLGLTITRNLVELQGGRIWVESEQGKGSTFFFTIPLHNFRLRDITAFKQILLKTLLVPDKDTAEAELYLDYLQRTLPSGQLDEVLRDSLYSIGEMWHRGEIGVGDEHLATNVIRDFLSRVRTSSTMPNGLKVVIGGVAGEEHVVGLTMVANAFGRAGWSVSNLGANVPLAAFLTTIEQVKPDALILSITLSQRLVEINRLVQEVRNAFPDLVIGVGGHLVNELPDLAERLKVDFHSSTPDDAVRLARQVIRAKKPSLT